MQTDLGGKGKELANLGQCFIFFDCCERTVFVAPSTVSRDVVLRKFQRFYRVNVFTRDSALGLSRFWPLSLHSSFQVTVCGCHH